MINLHPDGANMNVWRHAFSRMGGEMVRFACRDMGMKCEYVVNGNNIQEIKQKAMKHAEEQHAEMLKAYDTPEKKVVMENALEHAIRML